MLKRILLIAGGVLVALAAAGAYVLHIPEFVPAGEASLGWYQAGPFTVIESRIEAVDTSRPARAYNDWPGSPERPLEGRLWRPSHQSASPLVIYSHGFMSSHAEGEYLGRFLASHGYVVAAVDYPLTNGNAPAGPLVTDVINQPQDASFIIDRLLAQNRDEGSELHGSIDPTRIAAVGLSLGGLTTQLIAFHPEVSDKRVVAAASIAGPTANLTPAFFAQRNVPFLLLAGEADAIVPFDANAAALTDKAPGTILVSLARASHTGFAAQAAGPFRFVNHPDEIVCPMLVENLETRGEQPLFEDDPEAGVVSETSAAPCQMTTFDRAMRPPEQLSYMRLVIFAFLESEMHSDPARRQQAAQFLMQQLPRENPAVSVARL